MSALKMRRAVLVMVVVLLLGLRGTVQAGPEFEEMNLVSNIPGVAPNTDANLVNPWGIALSPASPFWVADNGTGVSTLYNGSGEAFPLPPASPLVVTIPPPTGGTPPSAPTGTVFNGNSNEFRVGDPNSGSGAHFLFATENGTISGWNSSTTAILKVDNSTTIYPNGGVGAVYKGLALDSSHGSDFLYATNFRSGNVDVFDSTFKPAGSFTDSSLPQGFAPFGIQKIGDNLFVTFAKQDPAMHDDVAGSGNGFIDEFSPTGTLLRQFASHGSLNSPWGLAVAPAGFGPFGGDLLVGNFGDSHVSVYDIKTGTFLGQLSDAHGQPLTLNGGVVGSDTIGLWGITFGNGGNGGDRNTLYFAAGINDEGDGLFGKVSVVPEPASLTLLGIGVLGVLGYARLRSRRPAA